MKCREWIFILVSYLPAFAVLAMMTDGFQAPLFAVDLLVPLVITIGFQIVLWIIFLRKPVRDFGNAILRAINGDFEARFECDSHSTLKGISVIYNQLMGRVESKMDELSKNRILQNRIYENEKVYRSALELTCERVFEADLPHNRILYGYLKYKSMFPYLDTRIYDDMIASIAEHSVYPDDRKAFLGTFSKDSLMKTFSQLRTPEISADYRLVAKDGSCSWYSATVIFLSSNNQDGLKIIGYIKNINERKKQELEILSESQRDGLTGLYNKKVTEKMIGGYLAGEGRNGRHAVIMLDIDDFKQINDSYGHIQGDAALTCVAHQLQNLFRSTDVVGRFGGDEFLILMKNISGTDALLEKLGSIETGFHGAKLDCMPTGFHCSIGASLYPDDGTTFPSLFKKSDMALYDSKAHGKDRFCLYADRYEKDGTPKDEQPAGKT